MALGTYALGIAWLVLVVGCCCGAARMIIVRRLGHLTGSAAAIAFALLATAGLVAVHLVPGAMTILNPETVALAAILLYVCISRWLPLKSSVPERRYVPQSTRVQWMLAGTAAGVVAIHAVAFMLEQRGRAVTGIDILTFEMPFVVHWIQDGSIWPVYTYWYGWSPGNYPMTGDLLALATTLPWRADPFLRMTFLPFHLLTGVSAYALARELGAARAPAVSAAALVLGVPTVAATALELAKPDPVMFATFLAGTAFLARYVRTQQTSDIALAGLGLGLAMGTKWYGLTCVAALLVAFAIWQRRQLTRQLFAWLIVVTGVVGGFWLLRNLVGSGNPLYPQRVPGLFDAPFDYRRAQQGAPLLDYATNWSVLKELLLPDLRNALALPGLLCLCGMVVAMFARPRDRRIVALAAAGLGLTALYVATPFTAQDVEKVPHAFPGARYAIPGLAMGAVMLAAACGRHAIAMQFAVLVAILDGIAHVDDNLFFTLDLMRPERVVPAALVVGTLAVGVWLIRARRNTWPAMAALLFALALPLGYVHTDRYMKARYHGIDPVIDWALDEAPAGKSIGIAGRSFYTDLAPIAVLPLYGPNFRNRVEVMGRVTEDRLYGPPGRHEFTRQVRRESYDVLVLLRRPEETAAREESWAEHLGYRVVARGPISAALTSSESGLLRPSAIGRSDDRPDVG